MKKELEKIKHNYSESMKFYQGNYKSNHWNYINKKKRICIKFKILKNLGEIIFPMGLMTNSTLIVNLRKILSY